MKRAKIVRLLSDRRSEIGLSHVQIDQIANVLTGEPMEEPWYENRSRERSDDEHMADMISDRWDDKHLG